MLMIYSIKHYNFLIPNSIFYHVVHGILFNHIFFNAVLSSVSGLEAAKSNLTRGN